MEQTMEMKNQPLLKDYKKDNEESGSVTSDEEEQQQIQEENDQSFLNNKTQQNQRYNGDDNHQNQNNEHQIEQQQQQQVAYFSSKLYYTLLVLMFPFILLSISLHLEMTNSNYSDYFRYSYVLLGFSIAGVVSFLIGMYFIPSDKIQITLLSLVLSTLSQVAFITFIQTLVTTQEYKEASVCTAYYIVGGLGLYAFSYAFPKIHKVICLCLIYLVFLAVLGILIWKLKQYTVIESGILGGLYIYGAFQFSENDTSKTLGEFLLLSLKGWMLFIPFLILNFIIWFIYSIIH